jgi:predicted CopG family antitoxin
MKATKSERVITTITLPKDFYEQVHELAVKEDRSFSNMLLVLLKEALAHRQVQVEEVSA